VTSEGRIRVKAVCVLRRDTDILVSFAIDPDTGARYARLLGGGLEAGERADDAIRREIREEIGADLRDVSRLGVVENIFRWRGEQFHEIIFVFTAAFTNRALYEQKSFAVNEVVCDGPAEWVPLARVTSGDLPVYPPDLVALLV
jgi:ADP-ribose pyrophosphatase YjhB (NUDIX family)